MTIRTCIMLFVAFLFTTPAMAVIETNTATATIIAKQNNALKKEFKMEKRQEMIQKSAKKFGFKDPDNKWLWLGLISWVLGGLSYFIALLGSHAGNAIYPFLGKLAVVALIIGAVFLLIWIVKKLSLLFYK
jgi:purine-cytosine permease-like protein